MALTDHSCGNNILKNWRNSINLNHFISTNVQKKCLKVRFLDPRGPCKMLKKLLKVCGTFLHEKLRFKGAVSQKYFVNPPYYIYIKLTLYKKNYFLL